MVGFLRVKCVIIFRIFVGIIVVLRRRHDGNIKWFMRIKKILVIIIMAKISILICVNRVVSVFLMKIHIFLSRFTSLTVKSL